MLFYSGIAHPTVMMRKSVLVQNNLNYDEDYIWTEDQDLWVRMLKVTKFTNIPEALLKYRTHESSVGKIYNENQISNIKKLHLRMLTELGLVLSSSEIDLHEKIGYWNFGNSREFYLTSIKWFKKLLSANLQKNIYNQQALSEFVSNKVIDIYRSYNSLSIRKLLRAIYFFWFESNLNIKLKFRMTLKIIYSHLK
jgi:hypothetical protein